MNGSATCDMLMSLACRLKEFALPYVVAGDFNATKEELEEVVLDILVLDEDDHLDDEAPMCGLDDRWARRQASPERRQAAHAAATWSAWPKVQRSPAPVTTWPILGARRALVLDRNLSIRRRLRVPLQRLWR